LRRVLVLVCTAKWISRLEKRVHSKRAVIKCMSFLLMRGWAYFARAMRRRLPAMTPIGADFRKEGGEKKARHCFLVRK